MTDITNIHYDSDAEAACQYISENSARIPTPECCTTLTDDAVISYVETKLQEFIESCREFGINSQQTLDSYYAVHACKDMASALLQKTVVLQDDGTVTVEKF